MIAMYLDDLNNIGRHGATISLQGDNATVVYRFPDISEPPCGHRVTAYEFDVLWVKGTAVRWHE